METPSDLAYCKVVGKFQIVLPDSNDGDDLPDFSPMWGSGVITPLIDSIEVVEPGYESIVFGEPISVFVDSDGNLSQGAYKYVKILAHSSALSGDDIYYSIKLSLRPVLSDFPEYVLGPVTFKSLPNATLDVTDLTF